MNAFENAVLKRLDRLIQLLELKDNTVKFHKEFTNPIGNIVCQYGCTHGLPEDNTVGDCPCQCHKVTC